MRKTFIALAACGLVAGGLTTGISPAHAQTPGAPPPPGADGGPPGMRPPMRDMPHGPMGGRMGGQMHNIRGMFHRMREFALIYPAHDRALAGPDVQKIAEAFLLFNGNHTWKVTDVAEQPDAVSFALATSDGTAIAHFAMDRHTARVTRLN